MIMVDTSAWYAICDASDKNHDRAKEFYRQVAGAVPLVMTDVILAETWALLATRLGRSAAITFWETIREAGVHILALREADIEAAWHILNAFQDQPFSFADCTTFVIMERYRIERAFTFDRHFAVYRYGPARKKAFLCEP